MELKDLLGDVYKDGMTFEEISTAIADKTFVDSATLPKSVTKDIFDKTASELAKIKKEFGDLKATSMTSDEKLQAELAKAATAQSTYAKELAKLRAKEIFVTSGLTEADYAQILDTVVSEDEETTKVRAKSVVDLIAAQRAAVEKAVKADLLKGTARPPAGEGSITLDTQIEAARASGDMALVSALIRQQGTLQKI